MKNLLTLLLCAMAMGATPNNQRLELCRQKLKAAQRLDLLYALDWQPPRAPYVVAGPTFEKIPFDAKAGFAQAVNCFLVAGNDELVTFDVLDWQTGKPVAHWSNGQLKVR